jgi:hypothetical protein
MMTPAAQPAPSPTEKTSPSVTTSLPANIVLPTPTITAGPPEEGLLGGAVEDGGARDAVDYTGSDQQARLRETLSRQYSENIQALWDELEKAPEALKPALSYAIEVAQNAYAEALASLFD